MEQKNPLSSSGVDFQDANIIGVDFKQVPPPFIPVPYTSVSKWFGESNKAYMKCKRDAKFIFKWSFDFLGGNKIAKYESRHMEGWRALFMVTNTILCNKATWYTNF
jgi:hypothetical protein